MRMDFKGNAFNGAVAAVAAGAVAFAAFAMPDDRFTQLVNFSGLPSILSAAEPPLGVTARLGVMTLGALATFLAVWPLLRWFDPPPVQEYHEHDDHDDLFDGDWETPHVRRADAHPDAPTRRPIFAAQDLGEPGGDFQAEDSRGEDEIEFREEPEDAQGTEPEEAANDTTAGRGPALFRRLGALRLEAYNDEQADSRSEAQDLPISPALDDAPGGDADYEPVAPEPEDAVVQAWEPLEPDAEASRSGHTEEEDFLELRAEDQEEPGATGDLVARLPLPEDDGQSISSLLNRLNVGLGSCEWPLPAAPDEAPRHPSGERLSSMLDDLQKMASRSR